MVKKVMTKKQHYYPRYLLKHFSDDHGKVIVYVRQANRVSKMNYEKLCASNFSYESEDVVDNILKINLALMKQKWERSLIIF